MLEPDAGLTCTSGSQRGTGQQWSAPTRLEHRSRRLIHCNVTAHPSAAWTLQQLREAIGLHERYEYLLHDRDSIFAKHLDESSRR